MPHKQQTTRHHKFLDLRYALLNGSYFMLYCATVGYVYNYLSTTTFADGSAVSDGTIGIIVALVNILGVIGQTVFGGIVDKSERIDEKTFVAITMGATIILSLALAVLPTAGILMFLVLIVAFTGGAIPMTLINSMAFIYEKDGQPINYGVGRGAGSVCYALGGMILGRLWAVFGRGVLPIFIAVVAALVLVFAITMPKPFSDAKTPDASAPTQASRISYPQFLKKYALLLPVVAALILMYFCHNLMNTYIAKLISDIIGAEAASVDGTVEGIQGTAIFIQAMSELPAMFLFAKILEHVKVEKLMVFAGICYSIKHLLLLVATSPFMIYAAMVLQMLSFAILTPASVYLADKYVLAQDRNRGQALMGMTLTVGGLLASLVGGQLFSVINAHAVFALGVGVSAAGSVLMAVGMRALASKNETASSHQQALSDAGVKGAPVTQ